MVMVNRTICCDFKAVIAILQKVTGKKSTLPHATRKHIVTFIYELLPLMINSIFTSKLNSYDYQ